MLLRSQIRCGHCGELVASLRRHDFRYCPCGEIAIDGGRDYLRALGGPFEDCSIRIEEELSRADAGKCLAVLRALHLIAPPSQAVEPNTPLSMIQGSLSANIIWPARNWTGLPKDHYVPQRDTKKWLDLLVKNGLVARRSTGRRHYYRCAVEIATHPDVPDGLTPGS